MRAPGASKSTPFDHSVPSFTYFTYPPLYVPPTLLYLSYLPSFTFPTYPPLPILPTLLYLFYYLLYYLPYYLPRVDPEGR